MSEKKQYIYRVTEKDNVATALEDLEPGIAWINGAGDKKSVNCLEIRLHYSSLKKEHRS